MLGRENLLAQITRWNYGSDNRPCKELAGHLVPKKFTPLVRYVKSAYCGEFSTHGDYFTSSCQNGSINIYSVKDTTLRNEFSIYSNSFHFTIVDSKLSPDGNFIAYSSWSGTVHLVPFRSSHRTEISLMISETLAPYEFYRCAFSVSYSDDSRELAAGTNSGIICLYDLTRTVKVANIDYAHIADVNAVAFAKKTNHIIYSASDDGILKIWDRRILSESRPRPTSIFVGHIHGITSLDSKGDFRYIITNSKDQTIKLWDTRHPSCGTDKDVAERVVRTNSILWDYRHCRRAMLRQQTAGAAPQIRAEIREDLQRRRREMNKLQCKDASVATYQGHNVSGTLIRARFSPPFSTGQKYIYVGDSTGKVIIYDVDTTEVVADLAHHMDAVRDVSWHPYEPFIVTSSLDNIVGSLTYRSKRDYLRCVCTDLKCIRDDNDCRPSRDAAADPTGSATAAISESDSTDSNGGSIIFEDDYVEDYPDE